MVDICGLKNSMMFGGIVVIIFEIVLINKIIGMRCMGDLYSMWLNGNDVM